MIVEGRRLVGERGRRLRVGVERSTETWSYDIFNICMCRWSGVSGRIVRQIGDWWEVKMPL